MMESQSIGDSARCQQYCDLTQGCLYWTWYRRHCDSLPCLEDHHTKINVCYLLSSCRLVGQKCSGCSSGSRVSGAGEIRYWINLSHCLDKQTIWSQQRESQASSSNYHQTCKRRIVRNNFWLSSLRIGVSNIITITILEVIDEIYHKYKLIMIF